MGIPVIFANGEVGYVQGHMLDVLIRAKVIVAFRRSAGWVQIDRDPVRSVQYPFQRAGNRRDDLPSWRAEH
jgi:hypothetical protein